LFDVSILILQAGAMPTNVVHDARLDSARATLIVVDVQEGFRAAVDRFDELVRNTAVLVQGVRRLGIPLIVTEQYPKGLGPTASELASHLDGAQRLEKIVFTATAAEGFARR
jgi:nicotinamidase-related amidase